MMGVFWATCLTKVVQGHSRALATCSRLRVRGLLDRSWKEQGAREEGGLEVLYLAACKPDL